MTGYYTAQICANGHLITAYLEKYSDSFEKYCSECGAATIVKCPKCEMNIRGRSSGEFGSWGNYDVPSYCINCGEPYPWTRSALDSTKELLLLSENLTPSDVESFEPSLHDLLIDTPKTQVAAMKLKILLKKAGKVTSDAVYSIFVDIASETAKKIIWPNS